MAEESKSRDTRRRRRILEQGSDRLAFITGRIQSFPSQPDSVSPSVNPITVPSSTSDAVQDPDSTSQNNDPHHHTDDDAPNNSIQTSPLVDKGETEISTVPSSELEPELEPEPERVQLVPRVEEEPKLPFITPTDITSAINASRVTRLCCSIVVALLVVASYLGFLSSSSTKLIRDLISSKPLYLVLITNLTVVIVRILYTKQRSFEGSKRRQKRTLSSDEDDQFGSQVAKTLELVLVLQNVVDAVFMDCAVYAIVLICGLSLVRVT